MSKELEEALYTAKERCEGNTIIDEASMNGFEEIYPFTTENIAGYIDYFDLQDKSLLTVGSSGDQIINAAFKGAKDIPTRMSMLGEPISREASSVKLILSFVRTDNTIQERTIDVTEIIGTLEKDGKEEEGKQDPPPEIELPPDDKIEVEKPETPPNPDGGGGMNGNVDGWGPEDNIELPVN